MDGEYDISFGNMSVLQNVPTMMKYQKYRRKLRILYFEFLTDHDRGYPNDSINKKHDPCL